MLVTTVRRKSQVIQFETPQEKAASLKRKLKECYTTINNLFSEVSNSNKITKQQWDAYIERSEKELEEAENREEPEQTQEQKQETDSKTTDEIDQVKSSTDSKQQKKKEQKSAGASPRTKKSPKKDRRQSNRSADLRTRSLAATSSPFLTPVLGIQFAKKHKKKLKRDRAKSMIHGPTMTRNSKLYKSVTSKPKPTDTLVVMYMQSNPFETFDTQEKGYILKRDLIESQIQSKVHLTQTTLSKYDILLRKSFYHCLLSNIQVSKPPETLKESEFMLQFNFFHSNKNSSIAIVKQFIDANFEGNLMNLSLHDSNSKQKLFSLTEIFAWMVTFDYWIPTNTKSPVYKCIMTHQLLLNQINDSSDTDENKEKQVEKTIQKFKKEISKITKI